MSKKTTNQFLAAYKLYLKDKIQNEQTINEIFWDKRSHGAFDLSEKNINLLLKSAFAQKHKFPYGKIIATKKNQGKGLAGHFKDHKKKMSFDVLDDFVSLFPVLSYSAFRENPTVNKKYMDQVDSPIINRFDESDHYIFYYWDGKNIGKAHLELEVNGTIWGRSHIQYYYYKDSKWFPTDTEIKTLMRDQHQVIGNNLHLLINDDLLSFLTIHTTDGIFRKDSLFCTYLTSFQGHSFSGIGILEKVIDGNIEQALLKPVNPRIYNLLFQRGDSLSLKEEGYSHRPGKKGFHFKSEFFKSGNKYVGVYKGYYLDKDFGDNATAIRTLLLQIQPSGKVILFDGEDPGIQQGFCSIAADNQVMYITCDFQDEVGGIPRFQIILDMPQDNPDSLEGIYGGFSKNNQPHIGLILLSRLKNINDINVALQIETNSPRNFKKEDQNNNDFHAHIPTPVLKFFADEKFYNAPRLCISDDFINMYSGKKSQAYQGPKGFYYIYGSSSLKKGIVRYPVWIQNDGKVFIKSDDDIVEAGSALLYFINDFLILNFYNAENLSNGRPTKGIFAFCMVHRNKWPIIPGISLRVNEDNKAQAKREFLQPVSIGKEINLSSFEECRKIFDTLKFEIIYPGSETDVPKDLMEVLLGREYNLIVVSRDINRRNKILQRYNFKRLFFIEAMFEYQKTKSVKGKPFMEALKLSIEHGLYKENDFKKMLKEYCRFTPLPFEKALKAVEPSFRSQLKEYFKNPKMPEEQE